VDDLDGVLLRLGLSGKGKDVLGLAIGDLVDPEPLVCSRTRTALKFDDQ
jgi:hypothetical protein